MDRWVYSDVPREVKGDADALVCVVDRSAYFIRDEICCSQIKHLKEVFEYAKQREYAFSRGDEPSTSPRIVDDKNYMYTIGSLQPQMWEKIGKGNDAYQCTLKEGVTKENFAESCCLYNRHKNLRCEFDGAVPNTQGEFPPMNNTIRIHCFETTGIEGFPSNTYEANSTHSALDCIKGILENKNSGISRIIIENPSFV